MSIEEKEYVANKIISSLNFYKFTSSGSHIIIKCPLCEKDRKDRKGHLYLSLEKFLFYCHRCNYAGFVKDLFEELNFDYDEEIIKRCKNNNVFGLTEEEKNKIINCKKSKDRSIYKFINDNSIFREKKLNYLKSRLKMDDVDNIPNLILDVEKFLHIKKLNIPFNFVKNINENYISFLTWNEEFLINRNIKDNLSENEYRYFNIKLRNDSFHDYYAIELNKLSSSIPTVCLCEGIFDVLGLYYKHKNNSLISSLLQKSNYLISVQGKNYYKILHRISLDNKMPLFNVIIFSDSDVFPSKYRYIKALPFINTVNLVYNVKGKDFGEDEIDISIVKR